MNKENKNTEVVPYKGDKLTKYNQNNSFDVFHDEFDSLVERMFNWAWSDPFWVTKRNYRLYDLKETDKSYVIEVELPRYKREEIKLQVVNGTIQLVAENSRGYYSKSWTLSNVDVNSVTSKLEDGVLTITVNKTPEAQPKVIDIQ